VPQPRKGPALGADPAHQQLMLRNLARSLFEHERIKTTEAKAKLLRPFAERLITKAKKGTVHHRRQVLSAIEDRAVVHKLFADIAPRFEARDGGYTRMVKIGPRNGDGAPMAYVELLEAGPAPGRPGAGGQETRRRRLRRPARRRAGTDDAGAPEDKPVRSRGEQAGAAGTPPGRAEPEPAADDQPPPQAPDGAGDDADAGPRREGAPGAGGAPGKQGD
jgi:large subunit ribosomal protein L17